MNTDCENDTSFDSIPSMASERSTRISTMKWPYTFNPKLLDKRSSQDSPIKAEIEKKIKSSRRKIDSNFFGVQRLRTQPETEYTLEIDKSDPFMQPSLQIDIKQNPPKKKIKGLKNSEDLPFDRTKQSAFLETTDSLNIIDQSKQNKKNNYYMDLPLQKINLSQTKENKHSIIQNEFNSDIKYKKAASGSKHDSIDDIEELNRLSFFTSPIQEENNNTIKYSPIKSIAYKLGMNSHSKCMEASQESMVHFDRAQIDSVDKVVQRGTKCSDKSNNSRQELINMDSDCSPKVNNEINVDLPSSNSSNEKERPKPMASIANPGFNSIERKDFEPRNHLKNDPLPNEKYDSISENSPQSKKAINPYFIELEDEYLDNECEKKFQSPEKNAIVNNVYPPQNEIKQFESELKEFILLETEAGNPSEEKKDLEDSFANSARTNKFQTPLPDLSESQTKRPKLKELMINIEDQESMKIPKKLINELQDATKNTKKNEIDTLSGTIVDYVTPTNNNKISLSNFKSDSQRSAQWMNQMNTASSRFVSTTRANKILLDKDINLSSDLRNSHTLTNIELTKEYLKDKESFILHDAVNEKEIYKNIDQPDFDTLLSPQGIPYSYSDRKILQKKDIKNYIDNNQIREDFNDDIGESEDNSAENSPRHNKIQYNVYQLSASNSKSANNQAKPQLVPKLKLLEVSSAQKFEQNESSDQNKSRNNKKNEIHYDPNLGLQKIHNTKKQPAIPIPPSRNNIKNLQNKAAKESKIKNNKENFDKGNSQRHNTSVQNLMNAKRINHSNSFNSSISGSTSKNSFKENTNTSLNMKSTKSDKILIAKTGISDKLNPLSKHKQVQKVDSRVQQKYPFEEKYTII